MRKNWSTSIGIVSVLLLGLSARTALAENETPVRIGNWVLQCSTTKGCYSLQQAKTNDHRTYFVIYYNPAIGGFDARIGAEYAVARPMNVVLYVGAEKMGQVPFVECDVSIGSDFGPVSYTKVFCAAEATLGSETTKRLRSGSVASLVVNYADGNELTFPYSLNGISKSLSLTADQPLVVEDTQPPTNDSAPVNSDIQRQMDEMNSELRKQQEDVERQLRAQQDELSRQIYRQKKEMERQQRIMRHELCVAKAKASGGNWMGCGW